VGRKKMKIEMQGQWYEILFGTDVSRPTERKGGAYIEMHGDDANGNNLFLFAYRQNETGKVTITMYREDVPLEVIAYFLKVVEEQFTRWPIVGDAHNERGG
jgi:hypothetical protein